MSKVAKKRTATAAEPEAAAAAAAAEVPPPTFLSLGLVAPLAAACERLKWTTPSVIQREAIPIALEGRDVIGLAQTGSGTRAPFAV